MSDTVISEAAKAKACDLTNAMRAQRGDRAIWEPRDFGPDGHSPLSAFARFIQEVSDAAKATVPLLETWVGNSDEAGARAADALRPFILPEPVDPVKEALAETYGGAAPEFVSAFHVALAKRGLKIVPAGQP